MFPTYQQHTERTRRAGGNGCDNVICDCEQVISHLFVVTSRLPFCVSSIEEDMSHVQTYKRKKLESVSYSNQRLYLI